MRRKTRIGKNGRIWNRRGKVGKRRTQMGKRRTQMRKRRKCEDETDFGFEFTGTTNVSTPKTELKNIRETKFIV